MTLTLPELKGLVVGEYGKVQSVILKDFDGAVQNVSTYTGMTLVFRSPEGTKTVTASGAFVTDGSDGAIAWAFTSDSYLDRPGTWEGQAELTKTGFSVKSLPFDVPVEKTLRS